MLRPRTPNLIAKLIAMAAIMCGSTMAVAITPYPRIKEVVQPVSSDGRPSELLTHDDRFAYTTCGLWSQAVNRSRNETAMVYLNSIAHGCSGRRSEFAVKVNLAEFDSAVQWWSDKDWKARQDWPHPVLVEMLGQALQAVKTIKEALVTSTPAVIAAYNADAEKVVSDRKAQQAAKAADEQRRQMAAVAAQKEQQARVDAESKRWEALTPAQRGDEERRVAQQQLSELIALCNNWRKFLDAGLSRGDYHRASQVSTRMRSEGCTNYQF